MIGGFDAVTKGLINGLEDLDVGGKDHPNYSIIENGQNTEKSPRDLRGLVVTQTPLKDHKLTLATTWRCKTLKVSIAWKNTSRWVKDKLLEQLDGFMWKTLISKK